MAKPKKQPSVVWPKGMTDTSSAKDKYSISNWYGMASKEDDNDYDDPDDIDMSNEEEYKQLEAKVWTKFKERFSLMDWARTEFEDDWLVSDAQIEAKYAYDQFGRLQVNIPMEAALCELAEGREAGKLNFTIEPLDQPDADEIVVAKQALAYHISSGDFYTERDKIRRDRRIYGTAVAYTGITYSRTCTYTVKEDEDIDMETPFYDNTIYEEHKEDKYTLTGKFVPIRHFWMDERCIWTGDFRKANDCIMQETTTLEEVKERWGDNKFFHHIDELNEVTDRDPAFTRQPSNGKGQVILYYYYNKVTKDYWIMGNYTHILYIGKMLYKHGELPFKTGQYYPRHNCTYGWGIPARVRYLKAYKTQTWQNMLDNSQMSGAPIVMIGNDGEVDGQAYVSPSEINQWRFTEGLDNVKMTSIPNNLWAYQTLLTAIDDQVVQDTWENLRSPYQKTADQLGTVEIMENNRLTRVKPMDSSDDMFLGDILQHTLDNITQFAYSLTRRTIKTKEWGVEVVSNPVITIPDAKVISSQNGKIIMDEDQGEFGFFEFKKDMIKSRYRIRIVHSSNTNIMKVLDKNSATQFIQNKVQLWSIDPTLVDKGKLQVWDKYLDMIYGYDDKIMPMSKKDEIKRKNLALMSQIKAMLWLEQSDPGVTAMMDQQNADAQAAQWWQPGQSPMGWMPQQNALPPTNWNNDISNANPQEAFGPAGWQFGQA
jgi:hypothetical protein